MKKSGGKRKGVGGDTGFKRGGLAATKLLGNTNGKEGETQVP